MTQPSPRLQSPRSEPTVRAAPPARHRWWALVTVGIAQLLVVLNAFVVNIALPSAQAELGLTDADRQWVITAYALAFGSLLLLGGRLVDLLGTRRAFMVGLTGFASSSTLVGFADSFGVLIAGRALQGVFSALLAPAALAVLATTFTLPQERTRAFGIFGAVASSGGAIGLLLGGSITEYLNWRWTLFVNAIIAAVALVGAIAFVASVKRPVPRQRLDVPGAVLVSSGLFGIVYGFANANSGGWRSLLTWIPIALGVLLLVVFVGWQRRSSSALLPLWIPFDRNRGASYLSLLIAGSGMFAVFLFLTYYLQISLRYSPVLTGFAFLPMTAALIIASQLTSNVLVPKLGARAAVTAAMLIGAAGLLLLTRLDLSSTYLANVLPSLIMIGFALGVVIPAALMTATAGVDRQRAGVAAAVVNASQQIGGSIGTALLNSIVATASAAAVAAGTATRATAPIAGFAAAYRWAAAFFLVGAILAAVIFRSPSAPAAALNSRQG